MVKGIPGYKNRFAKYNALHKDKKKIGIKTWRASNKIRTRDYNAWYRDKTAGKTTQTWAERSIQLGYDNASIGRQSNHRKQHEIRDGIVGKSCSACQTWSPLDNYNLNSKAWDKKRTTCKDCMAKKRKQKCSERTAYMKGYEKKRKKEDPEFALMKRLRSRINSAIRAHDVKKSASTSSLLGCSIRTAKKHIEEQFEDWMNWSNMDDWVIDHIIPFKAFKGELLHGRNQHIVSWYKNLQPLSPQANAAKGGKYEEEDKQDLIRRYNEDHLS